MAHGIVVPAVVKVRRELQWYVCMVRKMGKKGRRVSQSVRPSISDGSCRASFPFATVSFLII